MLLLKVLLFPFILHSYIFRDAMICQCTASHAATLQRNYEATEALFCWWLSQEEKRGQHSKSFLHEGGEGHLSVWGTDQFALDENGLKSMESLYNPWDQVVSFCNLWQIRHWVKLGSALLWILAQSFAASDPQKSLTLNQAWDTKQSYQWKTLKV